MNTDNVYICFTAETTEEKFIQALSKKVEELTSEVKAIGKDPTVKPKLDCIHGLGIRARQEESGGNPVVQAMIKRINELQTLLGRRPDGANVVNLIRNSINAKPLLDLDTTHSRPPVGSLMGGPMGGPAGRGSLLGKPENRGSLLGTPTGNFGRSDGRFGSNFGGGGGGFEPNGGRGFDSGYGEAPAEDVGATIGQLRQKLAELGSMFGRGDGPGMMKHGGFDDSMGMPRGGMQQSGIQPLGGMQRGGMQRGGMQRGGMQRGGMQRGGMQRGGMQPLGMGRGGRPLHRGRAGRPM